MKPTDLRGAIAIAGVGEAGCGEAHGFTEMEILAESARKAVEDAGLKMSDIDGLMTASVSSTMWGMGVAEYLGIKPTFTDNTMIGGSSFVAHLQQAALALQAGICNAVLVCYGSTQRTGVGRAQQGKLRSILDPLPYEAPYAPFNPPASA
jgi:3-oxoacyl-[acyl-carrier-protein] synthase III